MDILPVWAYPIVAVLAWVVLAFIGQRMEYKDHYGE